MDQAIIQQILANLFSFHTLIALLIGVVGGMIMGALPGLSSTMAVALLVPITFGMEPVAGLVMLTAIYTSATYGGSLSAILLHTPGTPASAATALDGYELTKKGQASRAIGIATVSSMIGGFISGLALLFLAPPLAKVSLLFSAPEYLFLSIFGLTIIGSLSGGSVIKGLASGAIGLLIGTIGIDIITGFPRYTFGITSLESGISLIPALIGLFSLSQVFILLEGGNTEEKSNEIKQLISKLIPSKEDFNKIFATILRSSGLGVLIGILPGAGGDVGSWVAYNEAKRFSKHKEEFGKGSIEGIAGSETANNAVTGGALIPLLTLGIPGSSTTAVLLGGLMIQGLVPGNDLFTVHADVSYSVILGFLIANILMGIVGLFGAKYFIKVLNVPQNMLIPIIIALCVIGSYAINNNVFDICIMLIFGVIGYAMRKTGFSPAPVILGLILGPIAEKSLGQSMVMAQGDLFGYFVSRPVTVVFMVLIVVTVVSPLIINVVKNRKTNNV
ncbi:tripartite tricarboxylate transporter permease [Pseudogracilibacillus sp. SO10305]|uniref:tripartite tricarboxylate transporter permease n=1 Tax=Pseudogracilibacillus sp. SO10305 TaxID=3098292 RepID=UPI00300E5EF3